VPQLLFDVLEREKQRLIASQEKFGNYIAPDKFPEV
jgi:hypothetical protein